MVDDLGARSVAKPRRRSSASRRRAACLAWLLALQGAVAADDLNVLNGTTAGGGGVAAAGSFRLVWTLGEPVMGTTTAGGFRLTSGFPATIGDDEFQGGPVDGDIFKDGSEDLPGGAR